MTIRIVPIEIRPISAESSVDLNSRCAKNINMMGTMLAKRPTPPNKNEYVALPNWLSRSNQTPAAEIRARINKKNAIPSRW